MSSKPNSSIASGSTLRPVLLLVGAQAALLREPPAGVRSSAQMRTNILQLLTHARSLNPPPLIIHVRNNGQKGEPDEPGTPGWQLVFPPLSHEHVIDKLKNDAFAGTKLGNLIPTDAEIVIAGMQTDYCIRATCSAGLGRGNNITLIRDAHATYDGMATSIGAMGTPASKIESETEQELEEAGISLENMSSLHSLFDYR